MASNSSSSSYPIRNGLIYCERAVKLPPSSVQVRLPVRLLVEVYGLSQAAVAATAGGITALRDVQVVLHVNGVQQPDRFTADVRVAKASNAYLVTTGINRFNAYAGWYLNQWLGGSSATVTVSRHFCSQELGLQPPAAGGTPVLQPVEVVVFRDGVQQPGSQPCALKLVGAGNQYLIMRTEGNRTGTLKQYLCCHVVGSCKLQGSLLREAVLGLMAGVFISLGYATCMIAAGQLSPAYRAANPGIFNLLFGAFGMPMGLALCLINGASLFTSNVAYMGAAKLERKASCVRSLQLLLLSYFANIAGCLLVAQFMAAGDVFLHRKHFSVELAGKLAGSGSFRSTLVKGVLGNWLLCMAVWQATAAQDVTGKLLAVMFPVSAYVTMGLEHCIDNSFVYQLALKLGGPPLPPFIVNNLLACTLGNVIGGGCFVAAAYSLAFGSLEKKAREKLVSPLQLGCAGTAALQNSGLDDNIQHLVAAGSSQQQGSALLRAQDGSHCLACN
ncbi:hypothetical protein OEZ86_003887 [Tetradesmus obliquus]|nr:hypothetical protein OEZ86_003887 [Tetradesmus obliquus]